MSYSDEETRLNKLKDLDFQNGMKLIYEWVKKDTIGFKEFYDLVQDNIDKVK